MAYALARLFNKLTVNSYVKISNKNQLLCNVSKLNITPERGLRRVYARYQIVMKRRRKLAGPDRLRRRSEWQEWNYKSELFAFPKRLHEEISENTLRMAFTHKSYIDSEERKRLEMGVPVHDVPLNLVANTELIVTGESVMSPYVKGFVRYCYPYIPEEGVVAIHDYLLSDDILSHVSSNIGTTDLILTEEFPVEKNTLALTLKAIIGAIAVDDNERKAQLFVQDFICPQLVGTDVLEIWDIPDPHQLVNTLLERHGRMPYEARLIFESGRNTLEAIYQVGFFSDKVFLGQGMGETVAIAEEMAAYDVLRRLFRITEGEKAKPFGKQARELDLNLDSENLKLSEWYSKDFEDKTYALA